MKVGATLEGDLRAHYGEAIDVMSIAVQDAVNWASTGLRDELRAQIRRAFGQGQGSLEKAWQVKLYPSRRASMGASGWVYSKARRIHAAFDNQRTISAFGGRYLVLPLQGAIRRGWDKEGRDKGGFGKPRKWSAYGRIVGLKGIVRIKLQRGRILIGLRDKAGKVEPIFLLVRSVRLRGGLDLIGPGIRWRDQLFRRLQSQIQG
ncbi:hypothetical protein EDC65_2240 [Stella humosa]|uniref:Uncharacterized protein n=1 Tax=Stella humosa TaxID=94 RepID=A0A3N1M9V0_9PROT|nr:DUF6441 family protein [Stella humosa]ROQ00441.1 hypothetical protein EDC65_2240 [Stella humosa]BBK30315.1 hypothetical protein STHU_09490 [Stella humosa]